ncbi:MAG: hypothetical protein AB1490_14790 [Pseudomonadota bacterium]
MARKSDSKSGSKSSPKNELTLEQLDQVSGGVGQIITDTDNAQLLVDQHLTQPNALQPTPQSGGVPGAIVTGNHADSGTTQTHTSITSVAGVSSGASTNLDLGNSTSITSQGGVGADTSFRGGVFGGGVQVGIHAIQTNSIDLGANTSINSTVRADDQTFISLNPNGVAVGTEHGVQVGVNVSHTDTTRAGDLTVHNTVTAESGAKAEFGTQGKVTLLNGLDATVGVGGFVGSYNAVTNTTTVEGNGVTATGGVTAISAGSLGAGINPSISAQDGQYSVGLHAATATGFGGIGIDAKVSVDADGVNDTAIGIGRTIADGIVGAAHTVGGGITGAAQAVGGGISAGAHGLADGLQTGGGLTANIVAPAVAHGATDLGHTIAGGVVGAANAVATGITGAANTVATGITGTANAAGNAVDAAAAEAAAQAKAAAEHATAEAKAAAEKIAAEAVAAKAAAEHAAVEAAAAAKAAAARAAAEAQAAIDRVAAVAAAPARAAAEAAARQAAEQAAAAAQAAVTATINETTKLLADRQKHLDELQSLTGYVAPPNLFLMMNGGGINPVHEAAYRAAEAAADQVRAAQAEAARIAEEAAQRTAQETARLQREAEEIAKRAASAVTGAAGAVAGGVTNAANTVASGATNAANTVVSGATNAANTIASGITQVFCHAAGTLIAMNDGTYKPVEQLKMGDEVLLGGTVLGRGEVMASDLYSYRGTVLNGRHAVFEDGCWVRVQDSAQATLLDMEPTPVYPVVTANHLLVCEQYICADLAEMDKDIGAVGRLAAMNADTERNNELRRAEERFGFAPRRAA